MTNITRKRGDTYADQWTITDRATGAPLDITGHTFRLTVDARPAPPDESTKLFHITGVIVDGPAGLVEFAPSDSQANNVGGYFYDMQMTYPSGRKRTVDAGTYTLEQDITKA